MSVRQSYPKKNNLNFIDGFLYFTEAQVEQKKENLIRHSVCMAGFPKIKSLAEFEFDYQPSINNVVDSSPEGSEKVAKYKRSKILP
ncbi:MAG: hypothetical protein IKJ75_05055 [Clostridia bacterium]|nr:hypothetical protein [Clostridia bacterium]